MTNQSEKGGSRRDEITDTATALFVENGYSATSMNKVAVAAGITKASLYHHFASKEDLFIACVTCGYGPALTRLRALAADDSTPPAARMREALGILYDTIISSPVGRMSPLINEVSRAFPKVSQSFYDEYIGPQRDLIWQIAQSGIAAGDFREVDMLGFQHLVFGPVVLLSMSREMFVNLPDLDTHFPVPHLREQHIDAMMEYLARP
ncbi:MAG: TetR/AcrR family transcriptional regulator [Pseudomonadota bacterium]